MSRWFEIHDSLFASLFIVFCFRTKQHRFVSYGVGNDGGGVLHSVGHILHANCWPVLWHSSFALIFIISFSFTLYSQNWLFKNKTDYAELCWRSVFQINFYLQYKKERQKSVFLSCFSVVMVLIFRNNKHPEIKENLDLITLDYVYQNTESLSLQCYFNK